MLLNAQSLNVETIDYVVSEYFNDVSVNFLCITETWTRETLAQEIVFPGFTFVGDYSRTRGIHGGVAVWCRQSLNVTAVDVKDFCLEKDIELVGLTWNTDDGNRLCVFVCYRSPNGDFEHFISRLEALLEVYFHPKFPIFLMGDFNEHCMTKSQLGVFYEVLRSFSLVPKVHEPTRVTHSSSTIIDQMFTNLSTPVVTQVLANTISDHKTVLLKLNKDKCKVIGPRYVYRRVYSDVALRSFMSAISGESWSDVDKAAGVNGKFECFYDVFLYHFNVHFPLRRTPVKSVTGSEWVNSEIKSSSQRLKDLHSFQLSFPTLKTFYVNAKKQHRLLITQSKKKYYSNKICDNIDSNKAVWEVVSDLTGCRRSRENVILELDGVRIDNPNEVANAFNNFFINEPKNIQSQIPVAASATMPINIIGSSMYVHPVLEEDVLRIINSKIKRSSSAGPDDVPVFLLKAAAPYIVTPLTNLVNISISSGIFPSKLKSSVVVPVFKKGAKHSVTNYRPISISSVFAKLFEYVMLEQLEQFISKNNIIDKRQHGFRHDFSTTSAIDAFQKELFADLEDGGRPVGVFCDLSRAFDCVDHTILLNKLYSYGIRGIPLKWISSYLDRRTQKVKIIHSSGSETGCSFSSPEGLDMGVPQGGILAPVLFILYVNDLPRWLDAASVMYADDTSVLVRADSNERMEAKVREVFDTLLHWFSANKLFFNINKTNIMHFHTHQAAGLAPLKLNFGGNVVREECGFVSFLGIVFDSTLSFNEHCQKLICCLGSKCYQVRVLRTVLNLQQLRLFYFAHVHSRLVYGLLFWGRSAKLHSVFILQKKIIRCIFGISNRSSCRQLFKQFNVLTLPSLYIFLHVVYVFENRQRFTLVSEVHSHETRNKNNFYVPYRHLTLCMKGAETLGLRMFNRLPPSLKQITEKRIFKNRVKKYLTDMCCYSVQEFFSNHLTV